MPDTPTTSPSPERVARRFRQSLLLPGEELRDENQDPNRADSLPIHSERSHLPTGQDEVDED